MSIKLIGALLMIASCGGCGILAVNAYKRQESYLLQLSQILAYMTWELEYRLTPLPELCRKAGQQSKSTLGHFFTLLAQELEGQAAPDVACCMTVALDKVKDIPKLSVKGLQLLGTSLGQFDLSGQLKGLEAVKIYCQNELEKLSHHREERLRSYRVLGLCAGAALAILFI
ncbi:MAG: stage III sporulation protein AB [Oscillospiraceae bacterium]|nr:stage III sporulation protein AB [Oscillospiraceae bacterium]